MKTVNSREEFLREVLSIVGENCSAVEIGVLKGEFSEMIFEILKPNKLFLIDPFEISEQKYKDGLATAYSTEIDYQIVMNKFEFVDRRYSYNAVHSYEGRSLDFIYIDACHLYECVKQDLNDWRYKLKKGGVIGLHDYANINDFGVVKAVDDFCIEHKFEKIIYNNKGHDVALKKKQ